MEESVWVRKKIVQSGWVPGKGGIRASNEKLSGSVPKNGRFSVSARKLLNPGDSSKRWNSCECRKTVRTRTKNGRISVTTKKLLNPGEYREKVESVRVPKNCPDQYRKMVESVWAPQNCWIRATTCKRWNPCECRKTVRTSTKNGRISVSTTKLLNPGDYLQKVESVRVPKNCPDQYEKW